MSHEDVWAIYNEGHPYAIYAECSICGLVIRKTAAQEIIIEAKKRLGACAVADAIREAPAEVTGAMAGAFSRSIKLLRKDIVDNSLEGN